MYTNDWAVGGANLPAIPCNSLSYFSGLSWPPTTFLVNDRARALNNAVVMFGTCLPDFGLCLNGCAGFSALGPLQQVAPGGDASTAALCTNSFEGNSYPQLHYLFP